MKFVIVFLLFLFPSIVSAEEKMVFCNVGQGDASYIKLQNGFDILIDAGPDSSVTGCLSSYMTFLDNSIELIILSHADSDHYGGLPTVLNKYTVGTVILPKLENTSKDYLHILELIDKKNIPVLTPNMDGKLIIQASSFTFIGPSDSSLKKCYPDKRNECSYIFYFDHNGLRTLFTGDSAPESFNDLYGRKFVTTDVLKVPHHGSKNGLTQQVIDEINPTLNVISLGKNNPYGHPHQGLLKLLENREIVRTDTQGNIVIYLPD